MWKKVCEELRRLVAPHIAPEIKCEKIEEIARDYDEFSLFLYSISREVESSAKFLVETYGLNVGDALRVVCEVAFTAGSLMSSMMCAKVITPESLKAIIDEIKRVEGYVRAVTDMWKKVEHVVKKSA